MPCKYTDLGQYNQCSAVDVSDIITGQVDLFYIQTSRECTFPDGNFGILETGEYVFTFGSVHYKFQVV